MPIYSQSSFPDGKLRFGIPSRHHYIISLHSITGNMSKQECES
jgi:hypothetical protein